MRASENPQRKNGRFDKGAQQKVFLPDGVSGLFPEGLLRGVHREPNLPEGGGLKFGAAEIGVDPAVDLLRRDSGRIGAADQRTGARTRDQIDRYPFLFKDLQDPDMAKTANPASPKRQPQLLPPSISSFVQPPPGFPLSGQDSTKLCRTDMARKMRLSQTPEFRFGPSTAV